MEGLSETFIGINDALVRSGYLTRDRELAEELREGMERFLALSKMAQREVDDDDEVAEEVVGGQEDREVAVVGNSGSGALTFSSAEVSEASEEVRGILRPSAPLALRGEEYRTASRSSGSFSPRLSYGVWSTSPDPSLPPRAVNNVLHYIKAGHDSFAARLYWNSVTVGFRALRGDDDYPSDVAQSMFRYKIRYSTPQQVLTVLGHVLNQMLLGTSHVTFDPSQNAWDAFPKSRTMALPDPNDSGAVDTNAVKNAIHRDIIQDGGLVDDYLDTWGVERYLADRWGVLVDSITARRLSQSRNLVVMDVEPLLERITAAAVTIGEGPRYPTLEIDMAVLSFLAEEQSVSGTVG